MRLADALDARGVVCAVGAGGKKSTLYRLARERERAVVTSTVRIPIFDDHVAAVHVTDDPVAAVRGADEWPVGVVPARERDDRYRGYDPRRVPPLRDDTRADCVLVKADGARARLFKAPGENEPRLPRDVDLVVPVASVGVVGDTLAEAGVHRPERVAALTDIDVGDVVTPATVAAVLTHPDGGLKRVPDDARVVPVLNMVDDETLERTAHDVADHVLAGDAVDRVVLTSLIRETDPVVAVRTEPRRG